jgi:hypothetical protein
MKTTLQHYAETVAELAAARAAGDDQKVAALEKYIALVERALRGETVSKSQTATEKFNKEVVAALAELTSLDQQLTDEAILPGYHTKKRGEVIARVRAADAAAADIFGEFQREKLAEAGRLRAAAEANVDPTERMASELERARLAQSGTDASVFAQQAADMLRNGQPSRAALLLGVAKDKGARVSSEFERELEDALDECIPDRKAAKAVEVEVQTRTDEYARMRTKALAETLGVGQDGQVGTGRSEDRTRASIATKIGDYVASTAGGAA